jgi:hypothetical protein
VLPRCIQLLERAPLKIQKLKQLVIDAGFIDRQDVERGIAHTHPKLLQQVDVVAKQEVFSRRAQCIAQHVGERLDIFKGQQISGEKRHRRRAFLGHGQYLIEGQIRRPRFVRDLRCEPKCEFTTESKSAGPVGRSFQHGTEQTAFRVQARECGVFNTSLCCNINACHGSSPDHCGPNPQV